MDAELVRRNLVPSCETARRLIVTGQVLVDGSFADKPGRMVDAGQAIVFVAPPPPYVSRAGMKLAGAFDEFGIDPSGLVCLDAGSSTGGFTDCLLQRGAKTIVAIDVGTNQMHEKIRADPRVDVREQTDIRLVGPDDFESLFELLVGDLSFISLRLVLASLTPLMVDDAQMVLLVKPQFEAERAEVSKAKGVISDPAIWRRTVTEVLGSAADLGLGVLGVAPSQIQGGQGNVEFVAWLAPTSFTIGATSSAELVDSAIGRAIADLEQRQQT